MKIECKEKGWRVVGTGFDKTNPKFKEITDIDFKPTVLFNFEIYSIIRIISY